MTPPIRVLIADDDPDLRDILRSVLVPAGFSVEEARDGRQALELIRKQPPDLVILDDTMPHMTGLQVCEQLREDMLLRHLPIIMLTGKSTLNDKIRGLNTGVDDYVVKPFEPQELLARVHTVFRRSVQDLDANPLTKLPGNVSIQRELEHRISSGGLLAVCYIDLDRFKAFNDHYGFERGDTAIRRTAELLLEVSRRVGSPNDFIGHIGGDDFIVITTISHAIPLAEEIVRAFDIMSPQLFDEADRTRGYLLHVDRKGQETKIPLLSISIALVTNEDHSLTHPGQVAKIGAELKAYAKRFDYSLYVKERRTPPKRT